MPAPARQLEMLELKEAVGGLVRLEQTAASIYQHVLDGLDGAASQRLRSIQAEHLLGAHLLRVSAEQVRLDSLDPEIEVEVTPELVASVLELASLRSPSPGLEVLRQVERGTVEGYEQALLEALIGPRLQTLVTHRLLPFCRAHLVALDALLLRCAA